MSSSWRVAAAQMTSTRDVASNLRAVSRLVAEAEERGARHVALPENAFFLGCTGEERRRYDSQLEGMLGALQEQLDSCRSLGSLSVGLLRPRGHKSLNSLAVLHRGDAGARVFYDKIHLFDYGELRESARTLAGSRVVADGILGLSVCYDLRFPEQYRELRSMGAEVMLVPSAFTRRTGEAHWHALLRARAIETQSLVVAPAQVGRHREGRASYGHACIYDAWGTLLGEAQGDAEQLVVVDWDREEQRRIREQMPIMEHVRPLH